MKVAWLFPGQGSQEVGMGKEVAAASAAARDAFALVDATLGEPLSTLCFEGPLEELTLTRNTQPAVVATSCALVAALMEQLPDMQPPLCAAGHSLGEYSALVAAGGMSLEQAVRICRMRGDFMQQAVAQGEGAMAALVGLDVETVGKVCAEAAQGEVVEPANYNAHGQVVIAGHAAAVERASTLAAGRGGKAIPLKVSAPFHCALMRPAAKRLAEELEHISIRALAFPVIANVDATPNTDPAKVCMSLVQQVERPVQWVATIERMAQEGVTHALEIGPGKVLAGLVKRICKQIRVLSISNTEGIARTASFLSGGS